MPGAVCSSTNLFVASAAFCAMNPRRRNSAHVFSVCKPKTTSCVLPNTDSLRIIDKASLFSPSLTSDLSCRSLKYFLDNHSTVRIVRSASRSDLGSSRPTVFPLIIGHPLIYGASPLISGQCVVDIWNSNKPALRNIDI